MWKKPGFIVSSVVVAIVVVWVINFNNSMISLQQQIEAKSADNRQIYSSIRIKIEQAGLVANQYSDQVVRALEIASEKRDCGGVAKGAMLWLKEENPSIDPSTYLKLQQIIEAEFTRFEANQTTLLDIGRIYKSRIRQFPGNIFAAVLGISLDDIAAYMTVLTSAESRRDFDSGEMTAPETFNQ